MLAGTTPEWLQGMFSRIAWRYDVTNAIISGGLDRYWRWRLARRVAHYEPRDILDVACGTGGILRHLERQCCTATRLVGIDFTEIMLRVGRHRLGRQSLTPPIHLCVADALRLPHRPESFDAVTMMFGLRNFADAVQALTECYRVLRPGGYLCLIEFSWPHRFGVRWLYSLYFRLLLPLLAWPLAGEWAAYRYLRDSVLAFRADAELTRPLQGVGFQDIVSLSLSGGITTLYEGRKPPRMSARTPGGAS